MIEKETILRLPVKWSLK